MFGYIRPLECELRVREQKEYRAHYCGVCKAIGARYGLLARLTLQYDCAFLSAFLSAYTGETPCGQRRCLCHLGRGKQPMVCMGEGVAYTADVNVLLAYFAACDNWQDERRFSAFIMKALLHGAYRRAAKNVPALALALTDALARLHALERENVACTDEPSDAFAALMRDIIGNAPYIRKEDQAACGWMFYNLGRWVYLADAWDDREKDGKRGAYNPFLASGADEDTAAYLLHKSLDEAEKGYDLVPLMGQHGLVDNIMRLGCRARTRQLLHLNKEIPDESV